MTLEQKSVFDTENDLFAQIRRREAEERDAFASLGLAVFAYREAQQNYQEAVTALSILVQSSSFKSLNS